MVPRTFKNKKETKKLKLRNSGIEVEVSLKSKNMPRIIV